MNGRIVHIQPKDQVQMDWRHAKYFIVKAFDEENIHKSIKYGVWSSTYINNIILDEAFSESRRQYPVILLFR